MGIEGCGQFATFTLCCSFLLMLFAGSSMGFLPRAAALQELLQRASFPWGAVLQEQAAPACVRHGVTGPARKPALAWAPLRGLQLLPGACSCVGSPQAAASFRT